MHCPEFFFCVNYLDVLGICSLRCKNQINVIIESFWILILDCKKKLTIKIQLGNVKMEIKINIGKQGNEKNMGKWEHEKKWPRKMGNDFGCAASSLAHMLTHSHTPSHSLPHSLAHSLPPSWNTLRGQLVRWSIDASIVFYALGYGLYITYPKRPFTFFQVWIIHLWIKSIVLLSIGIFPPQPNIFFKLNSKSPSNKRKNK